MKKDTKSKKYTLTKEEYVHYASLDYARGYLQQSMDRFIGTIIEERIGVKPTQDMPISWRLEGNNIVIGDDDEVSS